MSDYYSIQEVGGADLAGIYPDPGPVDGADCHKAVLTAGTVASGWRRIFRKAERFLAILSADNSGLRVLVALDHFAAFIPWSEMNMTSERSLPGTIVRLRFARVAHIVFEFHLDDVAADALFAGYMPQLPQRDPPGRLYWPKPWAFGLLVTVMIAAALALAWLHLSESPFLIAGTATAIVIGLAWVALRPVFEEDR